MRMALAAFPAVPSLPSMESCTEGKLDGDLRFQHSEDTTVLASAGPDLSREKDANARWSGALRVAGLQCAVEGAADPLRIDHGQLAIVGAGWRLRRAAGHLGTIAWTGEASWQPPERPGRAAVNPVRFIAAIDSLPAEDVERTFRPALAFKEGLLARTLSFRKTPPPEWLASRRWEGRITAAEFELAGQKYSKLNARVIWNGASVDLAEISATQLGGLISCRGSVRAAPDEPFYRLHGVFDSVNWEGHGAVEGEFGLTATGFGDDLLSSLNATGQVSSKRLDMGGDTFEQVAADFDYDGSRSSSRLRLSGASALVDDVPVLGSGASFADGRGINRWRAELSAPARSFKLSGTFPPFRLDADSGVEPRAR